MLFPFIITTYTLTDNAYETRFVSIWLHTTFANSKTNEFEIHKLGVLPYQEPLPHFTSRTRFRSNASDCAMTTDPRRRDVYMNIAALPDAKGLSQEVSTPPARFKTNIIRLRIRLKEIRIEDYIKSYSTTGKPPPPVPQEPEGDRERIALGLPLLFQPYVDIPRSGSPSSTAANYNLSLSSPVSAAKDPSQLPKIHPFQPLAGKDGDTYYSISMLPEFLSFSHEVRIFSPARDLCSVHLLNYIQELRSYAYAAGVIFPPNPLPTDLPPIPLPSISPSSISPPIAPFFC